MSAAILDTFIDAFPDLINNNKNPAEAIIEISKLLPYSIHAKNMLWAFGKINNIEINAFEYRQLGNL